MYSSRCGLCRPGVAPAVYAAACQVAVNLAAALDGALALLKTSFVPDAAKALRRAAIRGEPEGCIPLLRVLTAIAAHGEGQRQLLRVGSSPAVLDVILEFAEACKPRAGVAAAVLLLRNLAFRADNKSHFLADPRCDSVLLFLFRLHVAVPVSLACCRSAL